VPRSAAPPDRPRGPARLRLWSYAGPRPAPDPVAQRPDL